MSAFSLDAAVGAAKKALGTIPTSYTCDNLLELPNYWAPLLRTEGRSPQCDISKLPAEEVSIMGKDYRVTIELVELSLPQLQGERYARNS